MMHRALSPALWVGLLLLAAASVQAQQYRWTDKDGKVQFTDAPPPPWAKDVRKSGAPASKSDAAAPRLPYEIVRLQKDFPVTLYTAVNCKESCDLARAALNKRGIPFKEVQVGDEASSEELKRVSGAVEVPTLLVGRLSQRGFEQGAFDLLLDSADYPRAGVLPARNQKAPGPPGSEAAKPAAEAAAAAKPKPRGLYDPSGLTGPAPKPGQYDPSGLVGPPPKPGQYQVPAESK